MNVPEVAKKTYEELKDKVLFRNISSFVVEQLNKVAEAITRAQMVHQMVDEFNQEIFSHPLVQELSPCKAGCSACCHTQVSVTEDEAELLAQRVREGVKINSFKLKLQMQAANDSGAYFQMKYQDRRCVFLNDEGSCTVYNDRPSVCRTNAVLGAATQCDTSVSIQPVRLVKTPKSDIVIHASFVHARESGALPYMLGKALGV
jgi:uncharacterized protein